MKYPKSCFTCSEEITEPLFEFGDIRFPQCQSCWLAPSEDGWMMHIYDVHEIKLDGVVIAHYKTLTEFGVSFFGGNGKVGDVVSFVSYLKKETEEGGCS